MGSEKINDTFSEKCARLGDGVMSRNYAQEWADRLAERTSWRQAAWSLSLTLPFVSFCV